LQSCEGTFSTNYNLQKHSLLFHSDDISYQPNEQDILFETTANGKIRSSRFIPPSPQDNDHLNDNDTKPDNTKYWQPYIMFFGKENGDSIIAVNMSRGHPMAAAETNFKFLKSLIAIKKNYKKIVEEISENEVIEDDFTFLENLIDDVKNKKYMDQRKRCRAADLLDEYKFIPIKTFGTRVYIRDGDRKLAQQVKQIIRDYLQAFCSLSRADNLIVQQIIKELKVIINNFVDKLPIANQEKVKYNFLNYN